MCAYLAESESSVFVFALKTIRELKFTDIFLEMLRLLEGAEEMVPLLEFSILCVPDLPRTVFVCLEISSLRKSIRISHSTQYLQIYSLGSSDSEIVRVSVVLLVSH